jgi:hypothetical protein
LDEIQTASLTKAGEIMTNATVLVNTNMDCWYLTPFQMTVDGNRYELEEFDLDLFDTREISQVYDATRHWDKALHPGEIRWMPRPLPKHWLAVNPHGTETES